MRLVASPSQSPGVPRRRPRRLGGGWCVRPRNPGQSGTPQGHAAHGGYGSAGGSTPTTPHHSASHGAMITVGDVDYARNGFDPTAILTDWYIGEVSTLPDGRRLRTFELRAEDKEIEIALGVMFPAWTFNGRVPGPALRATEGDRLRIVFRNYGSHPHSMHFHGIHAARMDGVPRAGVIQPGEEFVYEFDAKPFGCHLYHCHSLPLARHIPKGMYGIFVVDPDPEKHREFADVVRSRLFGTPENAEWQEMAMVMNAFDTNFDGENEFYACSTIAHCYAKQPIKVVRNRPVRIFLVNVTEFGPDQLVPPACEFLQLFRPGNDADADAEDCRSHHLVPGSARHSRIQPYRPGTRTWSLHVPRTPV